MKINRIKLLATLPIGGLLLMVRIGQEVFGAVSLQMNGPGLGEGVLANPTAFPAWPRREREMC